MSACWRERGRRWAFSPQTLPRCLSLEVPAAARLGLGRVPACVPACSGRGPGHQLAPNHRGQVTAPPAASAASCPLEALILTTRVSSAEVRLCVKRQPHECSLPSAAALLCSAGRERNSHMGTRREGEGGSVRPSARTSLRSPVKASYLLGVCFSLSIQHAHRDFLFLCRHSNVWGTESHTHALE